MASRSTIHGALTLSLIIASGVYAGCSSSSDGGAPNTGGVSAAGVAGSATSGAAGSSTAGGSAPVAGSSTAGGASNVGGTPSSGGAPGGGAPNGGVGGIGGNPSGGNAMAGTANGGVSNGGSAGQNGNAGSGGSGGSANVDCMTNDPLKTNNAKQDAYDCAIIQVASKWGMPDPMIVKAQIQQESSFQIFATSQDSPCGIKSGWTDAESKSFGLIQTTPACGEAKGSLLPNGHPNLSQDMNSADWATSVFNPPINLDSGVQTDAESRKALKQKYPGCTEAQYNMMAAGAFNSGNGAVMGCTSYNARAQTYVTYITQHYKNFAAAAGWPDPY